MKALLKYSGWVVALLLCAAAGLLYLWGARQAEKAEALATERAHQDAAVSQLKAEVAKLQKHAAPPEPPQASAQPAASTRPAPPPEKNKKNSDSGLLKNLLSGDVGKQLLQMGAALGTDMQYGQYFSDAHLTPEVEQQVRDIIGQRVAAQQELGLKVLQGQVNLDTLQDQSVKKQQDTRDALAKVLTPQQLASLDKYESALPEKMFRQGMEDQLGALAPGAAPETRSRTTDVLVEEIAPLLAQAQQSGMPALGGGLLQNAQALLEAFSRARGRLTQELPADQMRDIERIFSQQEQAVNAADDLSTGSTPKQ